MPAPPRPPSALPRVTAIAAGLFFASTFLMYGSLGWSLSRPEEDALKGLPGPTAQQARDLYFQVRWKPLSDAVDLHLGMLFLANNKPAPAIEWLTRAVRWNTGSWQAWYYLGRAERLAKRYKDADNAFRRVLALNSDYVAAKVQQANLLLDQGKNEDASIAMTNLLRSGADQARIAQAIGTAELRQGNYHGAERAFSQVLSRLPSYGDAHAGLAESLRRSGDTQRAAREARFARNLAGVVPLLTDDPLMEDMEHQFPTALSLFQQAARERDPETGVEILKRALLLDPHLPNGWEALIALAGQAKQPQEAERGWAQLVKVNPRSVRGRYDLAIALAQAGDRARARALLNEAIALDPADPDNYRMMGLVYQQEGNLQEAANYLRKAFEVDPAAAEAHVDLGLLLVKSGQAKEGEAELLRALSPPSEQPARMLTRELSALKGQPIADSFEQSVRALAERDNLPTLLTLLNNRKKPEEAPTSKNLLDRPRTGR